MVDFLISYKNNIAKIGKVRQYISSADGYDILSENNEPILYISAPSGTLFKLRSDDENDSLVYRFLANDILPSPEIDAERILYGD